MNKYLFVCEDGTSNLPKYNKKGDYIGHEEYDNPQVLDLFEGETVKSAYNKMMKERSDLRKLNLSNIIAYKLCDGEGMQNTYI